MKSACDIFDQFRDSNPLSIEDRADFFVYIQDLNHDTDAAMAVAGLTLALLEREWNKDYFQWLLEAYTNYAESLPDSVVERLIVGIILVMIRHSVPIRENQDLWDEIQEVFTDASDIAFTALCNVARTSQIKKLEAFNQQMTKELMPLMNKMNSEEMFEVIHKYQEDLNHIAKLQLDQNFLIFKTSYHTPFFTDRAANWLLPWSDEQVLNVPEDERESFQDILDAWPLCDTDKYALLSISPMLRKSLRENLPMDMLHQIGEQPAASLFVTNGYIQQLYRYFRLSPFRLAATYKVSPFELVSYLRDTLVYRLLIVGEKKRDIINELIS